MLGNYVAPVPAQQRVGKHWYLGSADAIYQSLNLIHDEQPDIVVVVGADHVYRMDFSPDGRRSTSRPGAACTVAAIRQPIALADQFGVIDVDPDDPTQDPRRSWRSRRTPTGLPDSPDEVLASMGNYVFDADALVDAVTRDADARGLQARHGRRHRARRSSRAARPASTTSRTTTCPARPSATAATGATSGRSTPTTTRTWTSSSPLPVFNLYNYEWPIYTDVRPLPAGQVRPGLARASRARRVNSIVSPGRRGQRRAASTNSVLSPRCHGPQLRRGHRQRAARRRRRRAARRRAPGDHRQERPGPGGRQDRRRPGGGPGPRLRRDRVRHHRRRQGHR